MNRRSIRTTRRKLKMYRALLIASGVALLAFPVAESSDIASERYQVRLNGQVVGIAEGKEQAVAAYENARLTLNSQ